MEEVFDLTGQGWEDVPEQVEADVSYYKVPEGSYIVVFGKLVPKYKDINGNSCEPGTPGSIFSHASAPLWLIEYHGTPSEPKKETILGWNLEIPENKKVMELYFNLYISWDKRDQWKNINLFKDFSLKHQPMSKVVITDPSKSGKIVRLKSLAYYYGCALYINILWSEKGTPYIDTKNKGVKILDEFIRPEKMIEFEKKISAKVEKEREERNSQDKDKSYTPPSDKFNEDAEDLDSFLNP